MARELPLFDVLEGKKRRKPPRDDAPDPLEQQIQRSIVQLLDGFLRPEWYFTHIANGELRSPATAGKLRGLGVRPGAPDLVLVGRSPEHAGAHWMEVKRDAKAKLRPAQAAFQTRCQLLQIPHVVVWSLDMAIAAFRRWDCLRHYPSIGGTRG
jgi:hypothetical protein